MGTEVKRNEGILLNNWVRYEQPWLSEKQENKRKIQQFKIHIASAHFIFKSSSAFLKNIVNS